MPVSKVPPAQQFEELWRHAQQSLPGMDKKTFLGKMATWVKDPKNKIMRVGGTTFMITIKSPGVIEFHTLGSDSPKSIIKDSKAAVQTMKRVGAKHLYTFAQDPQTLALSKATGLPFKVTQSEMMTNGKMQPAWRLDLDL